MVDTYYLPTPPTKSGYAAYCLHQGYTASHTGFLHSITVDATVSQSGCQVTMTVTKDAPNGELFGTTEDK